ncbi:MAG: YlmC/YmxH family sporulation protein [Bacilli bacterium]|nr:YlmC/YmxH family sporulation protein [Bacilli bacterium]
MKLSELQEKRVVSINDGSYIGEIIDVNITLDGNIESLVVEKSKFLISKFSNKDEIIIKWNQIEKIGTDIILTSI